MNHLDITNVARGSFSNLARTLTACTIWLGFFMALTGCISTSNDQRITSDAEELPDNTVTAPLPAATILATRTLAPLIQTVHETVVPLAEIHQQILDDDLIRLTETSMVFAEDQNLTGTLFTFGPQGLQKIAFADSQPEYFLTPENDWLDWRARFAQNLGYVAYWVKREMGTELWISPLPDWQPKLILEIDDVAYDFATLIWGGGNDRYLFFTLSVTEYYSTLERTKTLRTYIFDMEHMIFVDKPYWPGDCSILARSPQTAQIALWCRQENDPASFLLLEPDESVWRTQVAPNVLANNCIAYFYCAWSQDGQVVAFIHAGLNDQPAAHLLHFAPAANSEPHKLMDNDTRSYSFVRWSPDNSLLYYSGACADGTIQCPNVMSVIDQELLWRARDNFNRGEFGNIDVSSVTWSPNSRYLAMPTYLENKLDVIVFDITTQQELFRITALTDVILDLVWVAE